MRKMKRIIALITVAMFVLSFAVPTFAAEPVAKTAIGKDVKGTKYEGDALKLIALGIINGFEDGTVRPDAAVTRAQFAAIVAQELGIAEGVGQSTTKFSDVSASHWASGVINLAVGKGIIVGYPNGTFKPEAPVTYAEAYAMLVQMLGYGPAIKGASWPAGVLAKAASLGVSKGVSGAANAEMKRGDVIKAAANSLEIDIMEQDEWGDNAVYKAKEDKTILSEVFDLTVYDGKNAKEVKDAPMVNLAGLDANEVKLGSSVYELSPVYNANEFLGQTVDAWVDEEDDVVYYIGASDDETVVYDEIDDVTGGRIYLDDSEDDYALIDKDGDVAGTKVWSNIKDTANYDAEGTAGTYDDADLDASTGAKVKVVLDADDKVKSLVITNWYTGDATKTFSGLVKSVDTKDEVIEYFDKDGSSQDFDLEDDDFVIVKDNAPATLAEIKEGDILNVMTDNDDEHFISVSSVTVKGTADIDWASDALDDFKITIADKKYSVNADATYSDDANDTVDALDPEELKDLNGEEVTVYLDVNGDVIHVVSGEVTGGGKLIGIITKSARYLNDAEEVKFNMVNKQGAELTFQFELDDVDYYIGGSYKEIGGKTGNDVNGANWEDDLKLESDNNGLIVVEYELDSAGKLTQVKKLAGAYDTTATQVIDEDDKTIGDARVTDSTIIFDVTEADDDGFRTALGEYDDVKLATWDTLKNKASVKAAVVVDEDEADYVFITYAGGASLTTEGEYAVVTNFTKVDGDAAVKLLLPDGSNKTIVYKGASIENFVYDRGNDVAKGDFIRYELNSDKEIDLIDVLADGGALTTEISASEINEMDLGNVKRIKVTSSSSKSIFGRAYDEDGVAIDSKDSYFLVNSDTVYLEIFDHGELRKVSGVSRNDIVITIDTSDDGNIPNFVIVVGEGYTGGKTF